jgi:hypothetical protein
MSTASLISITTGTYRRITHTYLRISLQLPLLVEINKTIKHLKNNKAAGPDNIVPELLKCNVTAISKVLKPVLEKIWETEKIPDAWKKSFIIKIPKKGNRTCCHNWRGIILLNTINKIIVHLILSRISPSLEPSLCQEQAGFRPVHSCVDQLSTLRIIIEQSNEWRSPLYLVFIDFKKVFDNLEHTSVWSTLQDRGVPPKIINIVKAI